MTLKDLLDSGITIQGKYCIKTYIEKKESYTILEIGEDFEYDFSCNNLYLHGEIKYLYIQDGCLQIEI